MIFKLTFISFCIIFSLLFTGSSLVRGSFCPSLGSREARDIIADALSELDPPVERASLPASCIFRPDNDVQLRAETLLLSSKEHNHVSGSNSWRCPICRAGEIDPEQPASPVRSRRAPADRAAAADARRALPTGGFWSEPLLERHLWQMHEAQVGRNHSSEVCLAHYCDILRCPSFLRPSPSALADDVGYYTSHVTNICGDPRAAAVRNNVCFQVVSQCFPPERDAESYAHYQLLTAQLCRPFQCDLPAAAAIPPSSPATLSSSRLYRYALYIFAIGVLGIYIKYWYSTRRMLNTSDFRRPPRNQSLWKQYQ